MKIDDGPRLPRSDGATPVPSRPLDSIAGLVETIAVYERSKQSTISLVPTENCMSPLAVAALSSDLANRYHLLDTSIWEYPDNSILTQISDATAEATGELFGCDYVNLRPLSGLSCMTSVLSAFRKVAETVFTVPALSGGHGATQLVAKNLGYRVADLPMSPDGFEVDLAALNARVNGESVLVYIDHSNFLKPLDASAMVDVVGAGSIVYYDISHLMGIMAGLPRLSPLRQGGCVVVGGSTHKTFPGPQKGIVLSNDEELHALVEQSTNVMVSNHHMNSVAALGITAMEMQWFGYQYSSQLLLNAVTLAGTLKRGGLPVCSLPDGTLTQSHQVWMGVPTGFEDASDALARMVDAGIVANGARLPSLGGQMGIRLGVSEVTRLGMGESEMRWIGERIVNILCGGSDLTETRSCIVELRASFSKPKFCFGSIDEVLSLL